MDRESEIKLPWDGEVTAREIRSLLGQKEGIIIRSPSLRSMTEEAPGTYKNVVAVVYAADKTSLARKVAKLIEIVCVKG
jgi:tRNA-splicing ligase RtcB